MMLLMLTITHFQSPVKVVEVGMRELVAISDQLRSDLFSPHPQAASHQLRELTTDSHVDQLLYNLEGGGGLSLFIHSTEVSPFFVYMYEGNL